MIMTLGGQRSVIAFATLWLAGPALAHGFPPKVPFHDRVFDGIEEVLFSPATLLPLIALGLLIGLYGRRVLAQLWAVLIFSQILGLALAATTADWILPPLLGAGGLIASLAALLPSHSVREVQLATAATCALAVAAALDGHGPFDTPFASLLGILVAVNLTIGAAAVLPLGTMAISSAAWLRILWRVAASWIAAALILYLAFIMSR